MVFANRTAVVSSTSNFTLTATFTETPALDNTYLLVAVVQTGFVHSGSNVQCPLPAGWTRSPVSYGLSNIWSQDIFVKRGDSSTNSITVTLGEFRRMRVALFAFKGYVSLTPIATYQAYTDWTVNPVAYPGPTTSAEGNGVSIVNGIAFNTLDSQPASWTNGYVQDGAYSLNYLAAYKQWRGSADVYNSNVTIAPPGGGGWIGAIYPLVNPITKSYAKGAIPVTLAKGSIKVEGQKG